MRLRMASACEVFGRRANIASFSFSSVVTLSGLVGRPVAIPKYAPAGHSNEFMTHDTNEATPAGRKVGSGDPLGCALYSLSPGQRGSRDRPD